MKLLKSFTQVPNSEAYQGPPQNARRNSLRQKSTSSSR